MKFKQISNFENNEKPKNWFRRLDDRVQQHYNLKVAKIEKNGGSRYDLAQEYLTSSKRWSHGFLMSSVNAFLTTITLWVYFTDQKLHRIEQKFLERMANLEDSNVKDISLEIYKLSKVSSRPEELIHLTGFFLVSNLLIYNSMNMEDIDYWNISRLLSGLGGISKSVQILKKIQYGYIINADPNVKSKNPSFAERFSKALNKISEIVYSPSPQPSPAKVNYSLEDKI